MRSKSAHKALPKESQAVPLHHTVVAIVSEARAELMSDRDGWAKLRFARGHVLIQKAFRDTREIAEQLDTFAAYGLEAWVE